jgi:hypothetical protein
MSPLIVDLFAQAEITLKECLASLFKQAFFPETTLERTSQQETTLISKLKEIYEKTRLQILQLFCINLIVNR